MIRPEEIKQGETIVNGAELILSSRLALEGYELNQHPFYWLLRLMVDKYEPQYPLEKKVYKALQTAEKYGTPRMLEETIKKIPRTNAARTIPPDDHLDVIFDKNNRVLAGYEEQVYPSTLQYYEGRLDLDELPKELQCIQINDLLSMPDDLLESSLFEEVFSSIGVQRELRMGFDVTTGPIAEIRKKYCEDQSALTLVDSLLAVYQQSR